MNKDEILKWACMHATTVYWDCSTPDPQVDSLMFTATDITNLITAMLEQQRKEDK